MDKAVDPISEQRSLLCAHSSDLKTLFPYLGLVETRTQRFLVAGNLGFTVRANGETIRDDYDIEIDIPPDYPRSPPTVRETGRKIPQGGGYHINPDGTMCLGTPLAVNLIFARERNLTWFVKELVVRFLCSVTYKRDYGRMLYGELSHGTEGILEHYREIFFTHNDLVVLKLLRLLSDGMVRECIPCPCGSKKSLRDCHAPILREIMAVQSDARSLLDYTEILRFLSGERKYPELRTCARRNIVVRDRKGSLVSLGSVKSGLSLKPDSWCMFWNSDDRMIRPPFRMSREGESEVSGSSVDMLTRDFPVYIASRSRAAAIGTGNSRKFRGHHRMAVR